MRGVGMTGATGDSLRQPDDACSGGTGLRLRAQSLVTSSQFLEVFAVYPLAGELWRGAQPGWSCAPPLPRKQSPISGRGI